MSASNYLQIHFLTSYPASLLNRDDAGFAKRMPFGGASRIRVSSQCLKRHWRTFEGKGALSEIEGTTASVRSRLTFDQLILKPLIDSGMDAARATTLVAELMGAVLGKSPKAAKKAAAGEDQDSGLQTGQLTVLGRPEVEFLLDATRSIAAQIADDADAKTIKKAFKEFFTREQKRNLQTLKTGAGLDAALFGRMVTSDILARTDAAVHVAHAMTVHGEETEPDYFTAVDDLLTRDEGDSELGSAHIGTTELTSGLFYGYVCVDLPLLVSNLEGVARADWANADLGLTRQVVSRLPRLLATVSPGAKKGSTAPYSYANLVVLEVGPAQPRTFANAFLEPVQLAGDPIANAHGALAAHLGQLDAMYGTDEARRAAVMGNRELLEPHISEWGTIDELGSWAAEHVRA